MSLSLRITLWFSSIFMFGVVLFGAFMWYDLQGVHTGGRDRTLTGRARRLIDVMDRVAREPRDSRLAKFADFTEMMPEGNLIQVFSLNGDRLLPTPEIAAEPFPWPTVASGDIETRTSIEYQGRPYRVYTRTATIEGQPVRIFIGGQLEDAQQFLKRFSQALMRAIPLMLVLSGLAGYFVSRRAMAPVGRLTDAARLTTIGNLSWRLPVPKTGDELAQLAGTWNEMLSRLEAAVHRITQFTSDASHELRSPISFIRTVSECTLRSPNLDPEAAEAFREIVAESEHAARLLEDMLMLARSDAGHASSAFEAVDLTWLVKEVVPKMHPLAEVRSHQLLHDLDPTVTVLADPALLRRLVVILLDNAIKYTPNGGKIELRVKSNKTGALLSVADNGAGIPAADLPRIFDRFFRVDASRTREAGTGLGLAIAKWIATVHHADIRAESKEDAGTTFSVQFPVLRSDLADVLADEANASAS